jgi:hypothetical protein
MFVNKVLKKMFAPKRDGVRWKFKILHDEEFHNVCRSSITVRVAISEKL